MHSATSANSVSGMDRISMRVILSWVLVLIGASVALLIVWIGHVVSVPLTTLLAVAAVVLSLSWLIVLATVPWNLYFGARRAAAEMVVSRERGIEVRSAYTEEAESISSRMLRFAITAHLGTAVVAAAIAYFSGNKIGYYIAGIFLISTGLRPAVAYLGHVRERIRVLSRESTYPREDVATLQEKMDTLEQDVERLEARLAHASEDLRRTEAGLADSIAHARQLLTTDLNRLQGALEASRDSARSRSDDLERRIEQMVQRIEATLDGISDHEELLAGLRALVRLVRSDSA
jgi:signal transduction histidine kinase